MTTTTQPTSKSAAYIIAVLLLAPAPFMAYTIAGNLNMQTGVPNWVPAIASAILGAPFIVLIAFLAKTGDLLAKVFTMIVISIAGAYAFYQMALLLHHTFTGE